MDRGAYDIVWEVKRFLFADSFVEFNTFGAIKCSTTCEWVWLEIQILNISNIPKYILYSVILRYSC